MRVDVRRVQVVHAERNADGTWYPYPPGTWVYTYTALVYGRPMDCVVAAQKDKSERWVRERSDGPILEALDRAWKQRSR